MDQIDRDLAYLRWLNRMEVSAWLLLFTAAMLFTAVVLA